MRHWSQPAAHVYSMKQPRVDEHLYCTQFGSAAWRFLRSWHLATLRTASMKKFCTKPGRAMSSTSKLRANLPRDSRAPTSDGDRPAAARQSIVAGRGKLEKSALDRSHAGSPNWRRDTPEFGLVNM